MGPSPALCFETSTTIDALAACLEDFTVPPNHYNQATYDAAQPTTEQRNDWKNVINLFLSVDGDCSSIPIPPSLQGIYTIEAFQNMCVLYEASVQEGIYVKGWGFMIVPRLRTSVSRAVHFSAPHPFFDRGTVQQAAFLFESTGSKSLFAAGRIRTAFPDPSECIPPVNSSQKFYKTDPAHNILEPFNDANIVISEWQHARDHGCPSPSCGFVQIHGKGTKTCSNDDIFLSSGLGTSSASLAWYSDSTDRPVKRLQRNLNLSFPSWHISLPSDSHCGLTATKNVFGRYLNGIDVGSVCNKAATNTTATGMFLHAEQGAAARSPLNYDAWSQAVLNTFAVTCADGMVVDPATKLCIFDRD
ncbi:hypothetical protein BYT27DRAFT_7104300 [Phlegmacium glaucopus]|nr:hypothetical protein BYT27DRAFT_7104300 [Phlegmacium glaucopus]